jgi:hypothetical protein
MNAILNWGAFPIVVVALVRALLNRVNGLPWYDFQLINGAEIYVWGACFILALASIWHLGLRHRCPECRSVNPHFLGSKEIDRFVGTKKVSGRDGEGRTTTHHVSTTFAKVENAYSCSNPGCGAKWNTFGKHEVS